MHLFIDTNIRIDYLTERETGANIEDIQNILMGDNNEVIYTSYHSLVTIAYILKNNRSKKLSLIEIFEKIETVQEISTIVYADHSIHRNLRSLIYGQIFIDLEDAVQMLHAKKAMCEYIITSDLKDFEKSSIPALSPEQFLVLWK